MKLVIAGSRSIRSMITLLKALNKHGLDSSNISEVVCGEAIGVDLLGEIWAIRHKVKVKYFPADWDRYGKRAGMVRNKKMAKYGDRLLSVWDGVSTGTIHMRKVMRKEGKKVYKYKTSKHLKGKNDFFK